MNVMLVLKILTLGALALTAIVMVVGVVNMFRKTTHGQQSNTLMRWRVMLQALTLVLFSILLLMGKQ